MKLQQSDKEYEYHLIKNEQLIGKGFVFMHEAPKFYDRPRMNYFIEFELESGHDLEDAREIVDGLVEIARDRRKEHLGHDARVYNCSFANCEDIINFYKSVEGFQADEGMHVLTQDVSANFKALELDKQFEVEDNQLDTEEKIEELLRYHGESFRPGLYIKDDILALRSMNGFKCISVRKNSQLIANLIVFITEQGNGFLEDMFVNKEYRGHRLGMYLVNYATKYMMDIGMQRIDLEVWSNNVRAYNLYKKMGYTLDRVSEVSIGMSI